MGFIGRDLVGVKMMKIKAMYPIRWNQEVRTVWQIKRIFLKSKKFAHPTTLVEGFPKEDQLLATQKHNQRYAKKIQKFV